MKLIKIMCTTIMITLIMGCTNTVNTKPIPGSNSESGNVAEKITAPINEPLEIFFNLVLSGSNSSLMLNALGMVNLTKVSGDIIFLNNDDLIVNYGNGSYSVNLGVLVKGTYDAKIFLWEGLKNYTKIYAVVIR